MEINNTLVQRSLDENILHVQKISDDVKSTLATIKGLCLLKFKDSHTRTDRYIAGIERASDQLLKKINNTAPVGRSKKENL